MNNKLRKNIIVLSIALILLSLLFLFANVFRNANRKEAEEDYQIYYEYKGKYYVENEDLQLILFAGLDSYDNNIVDSYRNSELSDCLVLLVLDNNKKTILPIQINRDTMCTYNILGIGGQIAGESFGQIALAHTYGTGDMASLVNTKDAVSELLFGVTIDYYVSLPMNAVGILNDKAGGISVLVEDDFSSIDPSLVQGEEVLLKGDQALTFVRSRAGLDDPSNIARMERQRVYLRALFEKCSELVKNDSSFSQDALNAVGEHLIANTNTYGLSDIANTLLGYELLDAVKLDGNARKGDTFIEYYVDEAKLEKFCLNTFYVETK